MQRWKRYLITAMLAIGASGSAALPATVSAATVFEQCNNNPNSIVCKSRNDNASSMMKIIINTLLYIIGIIAIIMIIVGGIRYVLSGGNASQVKEAKDTVLYSVIGLIVAIMSFAIVNFVLGQFIK